MLPKFITANGLDFAYLSAGPSPASGAPLLMLVHGFPDTAHSFAPLLPALAEAGYAVVAPFTRGYLPSAIPADGDYRVTTLARDLIALIDHLGAKRALLVGHDWGAVSCYVAAAMRPDRIAGLVAMSVPHLRRFLLRPSWAQLGRSSYMARFQQRGIEARLQANGCAELRALAQRWSPGLDVDTQLAPAWQSFAHIPRLRAALGYYRALPAALLQQETWQWGMAPIPVPVLAMVGADDGCIAADMFAEQAHLFANHYQLSVVPNAGHFLPLEAPAAVLTATLELAKQVFTSPALGTGRQS